MNAWLCRYYIVLCFCLKLAPRVMFVTSFPELVPQNNLGPISYENKAIANQNDLFLKQTRRVECLVALCSSFSELIDKSVNVKPSLNSRTLRSVRGKVPQNSEAKQNGPDSEAMRIFKYVHYDQFIPNSTPTIKKKTTGKVTTTTPQSTTSDRSLIPNSFFSPGEAVTTKSVTKLTTITSSSGRNVTTSTPSSRRNKFTSSSKPATVQVHGTKAKAPVVEIKDGNQALASSVSERPRRSPYRPSPRAALHRLPQRRILVAPPQPMAPVAVQVPIPLPYTQNSHTLDFGNYAQYGTSYGNTPQEEQSILFPTYKKHPPPHGRRAPPPGGRGRRPPPPRQRQRPIPVPRPRPSNGRGRHPRPNNHKPQYSYPKEAANIQDILNYFNENENEVQDPLMKPPPLPAGDLSGVSVGGGSDFSKELQDVQTSLLKDIREFAKRPSLMDNSDSMSKAPLSFSSSGSHHTPKHEYKPSMDYTQDDFHYDGPKPKPVRDMINYTPKPRDRESDEMRDHGKSKTRDKYRDSENGGWKGSSYRDESKERYQGRIKESRERERESEEKQKYRGQERDSEERELQNRREKEREREQERERERNRNKPKKSSSYSRGSYKDSEDNRNSKEDRDRHRDSDKTQSYTYKKPPTHPIVIKRPYGPYQPEEFYDSVEQQRKRYQNEHKRPAEYEDDRPRRDPYASVPRVKAPSITYRPKPSSYSPERESDRDRDRDRSRDRDRDRPRDRERDHHERYRDLIRERESTVNRHSISVASPEYVEDIVEIHTDSPYRVDMKTREERERREHLQKLYLEYLEKKMEAEALTTTIQPVKKSPMRMKIHIYPNENSQQTEQTKAISYVSPPPSAYSHHQPMLTAPSRDVSQIYSGYKNLNDQQQLQQQQHLQHHRLTSQPGGQSTGISGFAPTSTGPQMMVDKNKNVVLHLHVHRRNGFGEMEAGSEIYTTTVKPLTYKEIYDEHQQQQHSHHSHSEREHDNKSVSMELPIRDDKIEDVLHTLLQLRQ